MAIKSFKTLASGLTQHHWPTKKKFRVQTL